MSNVNTATISGNITRDPEAFGKDADNPVVKFGLAINRSYKAKDAEEYTEETSFIDVTCFSGLAKIAFRKLRKGDLITVNGRLKQETWETDGGEKRSKVGVIANEIDGAGMFRGKDEDRVIVLGAGAEQPDTPGGDASDDTSAEAKDQEDAAAAPSGDDDIPF
jgi:single-strand DNA-binding protein